MRALRARAPGWARADILLPLLAAYCAFAAYYVWQAWRRETPSIFTDELELTQISRAIAHTGHPARRGEAYHFTSLYPYLTAPAWWLHATRDSYDTIKYLGVLVMTATLFPAYAIARTVVSRPWALAAAVGAVAAPALSYSPILVEEPLAYPAAALALWLTLRAALRPSWGRIAAAAAAALVGAGVRSQLAALAGVLVLSLVLVAWRSERMRAWRSRWTRWDWVGAIVLLAGLVVVANAAASSRSQAWEISTRLYKDRLWTYGTWAAGGLALGLGILPLLGALAALVPRRDAPRDARRQAFSIVAASAIAGFGWYAAVKGAYVSATFGSFVVERNLVYLDPILFAGLALLLAGRGTRWWWALATGAFAVYLVAHVPYGTVVQFPYYEGHGLAITAFANRVFHWPVETIRTVAIALAVAATVVVAGLRLLPRRGPAAAAALAAVCAAVLVWNLTAETYAAQGEYHLSHAFATHMTRPFDWVDRATGRRPTTLLGQEFGDSNGIWLTEFWNTSIRNVWSADPNKGAPGPGRTVTPDLVRPDGELWPAPRTRFVLAVNGVELQAPVLQRAPDGSRQVVYDIGDGPIRLAASETGVAGDGWMTAPRPDVPAFSAYNRFDIEGPSAGFAVVRLSRIGYAGPDVPGHVTVRLGTLVVGPDKQPAIGRVLETRRLTIHSCIDPQRLRCATAVPFRNPGVPFRIETTVSPTFSPRTFARGADARNLAVQISYSFVRL